jgi:glycosyltransferase involved in cell wall biosynthesis
LKIRVLQLIKSFGRGGAEMLLAEGARLRDRDRFEYSYGYFLPWKDAMVATLAEQDLPVTCFGATNNLRILLSAPRLAAHLRRHRIDVLHCHLPIAGVVGRIAGRLAGVPVVYTEHNKQERYHGFTRALNRLTWKMQAGVIAVSQDVADSVSAHIHSGAPVRVILNGVDVDRFDPDRFDPTSVRRQLGIPPESPVVGTVAVFREQKRLEDWMEAARRLVQRVPNLHFIVVGDGPLRDLVTRSVEQHRLQSVVHLPGLQEDVRPYLAAIDVYMMSSIFEGLPVALLEAMSMGCVPVCTSVGGIPEVVTHGDNGFLAPPKRPEELAELAASLIEDPVRRAVMAAEARRTVEERFSMRRMVSELEAIYLELSRSGSIAGGSASTAPV